MSNIRKTRHICISDEYAVPKYFFRSLIKFHKDFIEVAHSIKQSRIPAYVIVIFRNKNSE